MRVTFITQDDPVYILPFFEAFLAADHRNLDVAAIFACRSMGNRRRSQLLLELFRLYGATGLAKLLAIQGKERAAAALHLSRFSRTAHSVAESASLHGIPYRAVGNPNHKEALQSIASTRPDVLVSVACPFILKRPVLDIAACAAINIHHAPLPRYRGMMPTFWQMYHGEKLAGITIHTMADSVDTGKILYQTSVPMATGETMHDLIRRTKRAGAQAMLHVLDRYAAGSPLQPVEPSIEASYFTFPSAAEMRAFRQRGMRAI